jgi:hypothetical protein
MLGTAHILMIWHGLYRSLPHREGGGGTGNVTDRKQELRRQFRFVRRNTELTATSSASAPACPSTLRPQTASNAAARDCAPLTSPH